MKKRPGKSSKQHAKKSVFAESFTENALPLKGVHAGGLGALMKKAERWVILLIGATVLVTLAVTFMASKKSLGEHLYDLPWLAIFWLFIATVLESLLRFWRYHVAGEALGLHVPITRMAYYYTVGYGLLPTPGKVGTAVRLWLLKQYHNIPYRKSAPLLVMDLVSDSLGMCALASLALAVIDNPHLNTLGWLVGGGLLAGIWVVFIAPRALKGLVKTIYLLMGKKHRRLFARVLGLVQTSREVLGPHTILTTTMLSMAGWGLVGMAIGNLVMTLGYPSFGAAQGTLTITLATMGGFLTMMPAGVGGAEVTMAGLLGLFGVPFVEAVLATAIIRLVVLWLSVVVGLVLLPIALRHAPKH